MFKHIIDNYYYVETHADIILAIDDKCGNDASAIVPAITKDKLPGFIRVSTTDDQIAGFVSRFFFVLPEEITDKVNIWLERSMIAQATMDMLKRRVEQEPVVADGMHALNLGNMLWPPENMPAITPPSASYVLPTDIPLEYRILTVKTAIAHTELFEKALATLGDFMMAGGMRKLRDELECARGELQTQHEIEKIKNGVDK